MYCEHVSYWGPAKEYKAIHANATTTTVAMSPMFFQLLYLLCLEEVLCMVGSFLQPISVGPEYLIHDLISMARFQLHFFLLCHSFLSGLWE